MNSSARREFMPGKGSAAMNSPQMTVRPYDEFIASDQSACNEILGVILRSREKYNTLMLGPSTMNSRQAQELVATNPPKWP